MFLIFTLRSQALQLYSLIKYAIFNLNHRVMAIIIGIGFMLLSLFMGNILKRKMKKYGAVGLKSNLSGKEIAEHMLRDHKIEDVKVLCVPGRLTDHYNPTGKTVNLSPEVYDGRSVAAAAVASHECGHAVQHATAYSMLQLRSTLVPLQNISAKVLNMMFMMMLFGAFALPSIISFNSALVVIIAAYAVFTIFTFVTLPVEFDASRRALSWVRNQGIANQNEHQMAADALQSAAMTYVIAAISSLGMLIYYLMIFLNRE